MKSKNQKFKLSLEKETLIRLQEQQMKALAGGVENMSNGTSSSPGSCTSTEQCTIVSSGCNDQEETKPTTTSYADNTSCCKKSCNP